MPMPPPNVTGRLHMGHAMFVTLQVSHAHSSAMQLQGRNRTCCGSMGQFKCGARYAENQSSALGILAHAPH